MSREFSTPPSPDSSDPPLPLPSRSFTPPLFHPSLVSFVFIHLRTCQFASSLSSNLYNSGGGCVPPATETPPSFLQTQHLGATKTGTGKRAGGLLRRRRPRLLLRR